MANSANNWLVADSEDEDALAQLLPRNSTEVTTATHSALVDSVTAPDTTSVIQTDFFTPDQPRTPPRGRQLSDEPLFTPPGGIVSTIDDFMGVPSTSGVPSAIPPKPRPRPRVVMKKAVTSEPNPDKAEPSFSHISDHRISAMRQTNDSIHSAAASSFGFFDAVDDAYSSLDIAERAKMRSRKSQTTKKPIHLPVQMNEVIELTSDEDELALKPTKRQKKQGNTVPKTRVQTKSRPKPRQKVKPTVVFPSGSPPNQTVIRVPQTPPPQCEPSSQLPASTLPTIPPSTPPQARELTPLSSPPVTTRKRRRIHPSIAEDDDEMDIIGSNPARNSPSLTVPPPFFAPPSSSVPTDSGIEISAIGPLSGQGKRKQVSSGKKGTQRKAQNKGRKGKEDTIGAVNENAEDSVRLIQEPSAPSTHHSPGLAKEQHSPTVRNSTATNKPSEKQTAMKKGKAREIDSCEEDDPFFPSKSCTPPADEEAQKSKENLRPVDPSPPKRDQPPKHTSTPGFQVRDSSVKPKLTPMSELIRRVNSQPSSPFPNASRTYSPFLKSSRTMLSRIAPLHPNRRTPPPPLPRPPPPKKSKKQLEMEERIDEELAETIDGWSCLTDDERKALRKARIDAELGYEE